MTKRNSLNRKDKIKHIETFFSYTSNEIHIWYIIETCRHLQISITDMIEVLSKNKDLTNTLNNMSDQSIDHIYTVMVLPYAS